MLKQVSDDLAIALGPISRVYVREMSLRATSVVDLYQRLSGRIPDEAERAAFLARMPRKG